ncbi:MAG: beta-lactamase family protein [Defluviitaleaceae bacterium]|nr:beta-lactamase family protein [Defluviitaleaceae bacterium]
MSKILEIIKSKKHYDGSLLVERMKECRVNAISIALIENHEIWETYTHGVKRRDELEKVTVDTLFQAASISKPVFAVAVMGLVERGILDIDTDISEYLVGYEVPTYDNEKHKITLRQILSHNAGLNLHGFEGYQQGQKIPTVEQILSGVSPSNHMKLKLIKKPETGYQYSGGGYVLAQKIVTDVCKRDFCELMNELVLSPLSMTRSTFSQPLPGDKLREIAFGYNPHDLEIPGGYDIMPELSAAGLWTTPSDLARLGIEIMKALKNESVHLKKDVAMLMTTKAYENSRHGIGFVVGESNKGPTFGHDGYNDGFISSMSFCPDDGSGIVVMINSNIGGDITDEVVSAFKDIYGW